MKDIGGGFGGAGIAAEEEDRSALLSGGGAEAGDEIGAGDALRERRSLQFAGPDQGHSVGDDEIGLGEDGGEMEIAARAAEVIDVGRHDDAAAAGAETIEKIVDAALFGDGVDGYAVQDDAREGRRGSWRGGDGFGRGGKRGGGGGHGARLPLNVALTHVHFAPAFCPGGRSSLQIPRRVKTNVPLPRRSEAVFRSSLAFHAPGSDKRRTHERREAICSFMLRKATDKWVHESRRMTANGTSSGAQCPRQSFIDASFERHNKRRGRIFRFNRLAQMGSRGEAAFH